MCFDYKPQRKYCKMGHTFRVSIIHTNYSFHKRLPCIQPYKQLTETDVIRTHSVGVTIVSNFDKQPVNRKKQGSAFPPNYIHSLDSCHMMLVCLRANKQ